MWKQRGKRRKLTNMPYVSVLCAWAKSQSMNLKPLSIWCRSPYQLKMQENIKTHEASLHIFEWDADRKKKWKEFIIYHPWTLSIEALILRLWNQQQSSPSLMSIGCEHPIDFLMLCTTPETQNDRKYPVSPNDYLVLTSCSNLSRFSDSRLSTELWNSLAWI